MFASPPPALTQLRPRAELFGVWGSVTRDGKNARIFSCASVLSCFRVQQDQTLL